MENIPYILFILNVILASSCTPLQKEAWRAGQAGERFPSPGTSRSAEPTRQAASTPDKPKPSYQPATRSVSDLQPLRRSSVIETHIDGDFEGWEGETVFKLTNGQIWRQVDYAYRYHYAFQPSVLIYQSRFGGWKMKVDGVDDAIGVERLR